MANSMGGRLGFGRGRRHQARPMASERQRGPGPRARTWLGWGAAAGTVAVVAFLVGRAGSEAGLASASPSPSAAPQTISFGTALDPSSGEAVGLTDRFRAGQPIAYSVRLAAAPGVARILVEIARLEAGAEVVVQQPSEQGIVASSRVIAFTFAVTTSELLDAWGAGDYAMRIYLPGATDPIATGGFTLVETPLPS